MSVFKDNFNIQSGAAVMPDAPDMSNDTAFNFGGNTNG